MYRTYQKALMALGIAFLSHACKQPRAITEKGEEARLEESQVVLPAEAKKGKAFSSFDILRACEDMGYQCQSVSSTSDTVIGATIPVLQGDILSSSDSMVVALKLSSRAGAHELKYIRYYDAKSAHKAYLTIQAIRNEDPAYNQALDAHSTELAIAGNVLLISRGQVGLADRVARKLSQ